MITNYHTHSTYTDGKNTLEEMILAAIERGFSAIGLSDHGYTDFDLRYCIKDTEGYLKELRALKEKYKKDIQVYIGMEEDGFCPVNRSDFDYILGSEHYVKINGKYYGVDEDPENIKTFLDMLGGDVLAYAKCYYEPFCEYIKARKPDIIGHFDLITKFDEMDKSIFFENNEYMKLSQFYLKEALKADSIFEVNTGAISRKCRTTPYPHETLLHTILKEGGKVTICSDSHEVGTIDCSFKEVRAMLRDIGFEYTYVLFDNEFKKDFL